MSDQQTTIKSTEHDGLSKLDAFLANFRSEAAHSKRAWSLRYTKSDVGSELIIELDPPPAEPEAKKE